MTLQTQVAIKCSGCLEQLRQDHARILGGFSKRVSSGMTQNEMFSTQFEVNQELREIYKEIDVLAATKRELALPVHENRLMNISAYIHRVERGIMRRKQQEQITAEVHLRHKPPGPCNIL